MLTKMRESHDSGRTTSACLTSKDMLDIHGLVAEFCLRNDRPEFGVVGDLFMPDATLRLGALTLEGRDAIASFFIERNARHAAISRVTRHVCGAIAIRPTGPDRAEIHTGLLVFAGVGVLPLVSEAPSTIGDFDAVCVRDPEGNWRFASRVSIPIFLSPRASDYLRSS
jgi:hypothetical protein